VREESGEIDEKKQRYGKIGEKCLYIQEIDLLELQEQREGEI
jgi:hypothetical protein